MKEKNEDNGLYDKAYKALFSNPRIFCQLVKGFVDEDFTRDLKPEHFRSLENRSFISPEFLKREADLIYHVVMEEREIYFYILLEFQSMPDKRMPVRLFSYLLLFYEQMIKHSQKGKLPAVFPMVLYNGEKPWNVPHDIREAVDGGVIPEQYLLKGKYYLLDENSVAEQRIEELHNLAAAVVYYEQHRRTDDMKLALKSMLELLKGEDFDEIRQVMLWALRITGKKFNEEDINSLRTFQDGEEYMEAVTSQWEINIRNKALEEGRQELQKVQEESRQKLNSIVRSMKLRGFETSLISEITGLSEERIRRIEPKS